MATRVHVFSLVLIALIGGCLLGYHAFPALVEMICAGVLPHLIAYSGRAEYHARASFTLSMGVAMASLPASSLLGLRFARRGPYYVLLGKTLLAGVLAFVGGALYHRREMTSLGAKAAGAIELFQNTDASVIFNPLTRIALASAAAVVLFGLLKATFLYSKKG